MIPFLHPFGPSCGANHLVRRNKFMWTCTFCGTKHFGTTKASKKRKFCNLVCSGKYTTALSVTRWLETGIVSNGTKGYILSQQNYRCAICNIDSTWQSKPLVLILDHIDGNSQNNTRSNLRCVCPNCDSQLDTYKARNKGKGRHSRRVRYQAGQSY